MYSLKQRFWSMLTGWGSIGLAYGLTSSKDQATAYLLPPSAIDLWIDFDPNAIWAYLSFFLLVPLAFLACPQHRLNWLTRSMQLSALVAGVIFILWPTTMEFPPVTQDTFSASMLKLLILVDSVRNCLPSLHVTLTLLSVAALWQRAQHLRNIALTGWGSVISFSILQLHRHQFVDLLGGIALALCAGAISLYFFKDKAAICVKRPI